MERYRRHLEFDRESVESILRLVEKQHGPEARQEAAREAEIRETIIWAALRWMRPEL